jgi:hypothetical protein
LSNCKKSSRRLLREMMRDKSIIKSHDSFFPSRTNNRIEIPKKTMPDRLDVMS